MSTEQKPVIILLNDNDSVLLGVTLIFKKKFPEASIVACPNIRGFVNALWDCADAKMTPALAILDDTVADKRQYEIEYTSEVIRDLRSGAQPELPCQFPMIITSGGAKNFDGMDLVLKNEILVVDIEYDRPYKEYPNSYLLKLVEELLELRRGQQECNPRKRL